VLPQQVQVFHIIVVSSLWLLLVLATVAAAPQMLLPIPDFFEA